MAENEATADEPDRLSPLRLSASLVDSTYDAVRLAGPRSHFLLEKEVPTWEWVGPKMVRIDCWGLRTATAQEAYEFLATLGMVTSRSPLECKFYGRFSSVEHVLRAVRRARLIRRNRQIDGTHYLLLFVGVTLDG